MAVIQSDPSQYEVELIYLLFMMQVTTPLPLLFRPVSGENTAGH